MLSKFDDLEPTNSEELNLIIKNMNNNKTPGPDNITNRLIKIIFANDREYIVNLFNLVIKFCRIPKN